MVVHAQVVAVSSSSRVTVAAASACVVCALATVLIGLAGLFGVQSASSTAEALAQDELATTTMTARLAHEIDLAHAGGQVALTADGPRTRATAQTVLYDEQMPGRRGPPHEVPPAAPERPAARARGHRDAGRRVGDDADGAEQHQGHGSSTDRRRPPRRLRPAGPAPAGALRGGDQGREGGAGGVGHHQPSDPVGHRGRRHAAGAGLHRVRRAAEQTAAPNHGAGQEPGGVRRHPAAGR